MTTRSRIDPAIDDPDFGPGDSDEDVELRVDEIERTRHEMSRTADEIGERLTPSNIVEQAKETVRDATVGKVEEMATTASDMVSDAGWQARQAGNGIVETIKRNPIPAAMAGIGIGWLWMNRQPSMGATDTWASSSRRTTDGRPFGSRMSDVGDRVGERVDQVGTRVGEVGDQIGRSASGALESAGEVVDDARRAAAGVPAEVQMTAREVGANVEAIVEENPLAVGAIALAVGTAVGLALPSTRTEQRLLGEASGRVLDQAQEAVATPLEKAEQAVREAKPSTTKTTRS
jgi:ElaB/YqjD/DUF883 family membrane-anchored ribosome-binding protein